MGRVNKLWRKEHEDACEAFEIGKISKAEFRVELQRLGFDEDLIDEEIELIYEVNNQIEGIRYTKVYSDGI